MQPFINYNHRGETTSCPFCATQVEYLVEDISKLKHDNDCAYLIAKDLSAGEENKKICGIKICDLENHIGKRISFTTNFSKNTFFDIIVGLYHDKFEIKDNKFIIISDLTWLHLID